MNHSKKSSRRKRRESIDRPPKARNAAPRRGWLIVIGAALCVVVAVVLIQWDSSRRSGPQTFTGNSIETQAPGAPPVDAAAVLQLASSIPGTVETLKAEATLTATRLTESFPQRSEAFAQLALLQSESGLNDEALVSWNAARQRDAQFGAAYLGMGIIRAGRAEYARAATLLQTAVDLDPAAPHAYRELTEVLLKDGQSEPAVAVAREFVRRFPELANSHFWLGQALLQEGDYSAAKQSHQEVVRISPDWSQPYASLASACARLGEPEEALRYRRRFAKLKQTETEADRQATRTYDDLSKQRQVTAKVHRAAAGLQLRFGDPQTAEAHWLRAAAIVPTDVETRNSLVALYTQQGRLAAAAFFLGQLAALEPDNSRHLTEKAQFQFDMGHWSEAQTTLEQTIQQHEDCAPAHLLLAKVFLHAGQLSDARHHARRATALSDSSQAFLVLAAVMQQEGDLRGARETLGKAAAADPTNRQLQQAYEALKAGE